MKEQKPRISIVTPSFNMLATLKMCHASIYDQDVDYEHIVVDGGSVDGTSEWLNKNEDILSVSENDKGMYDALNKAIKMSTGEIIGQLNCDEQYLPAVLQFVLDFFDNNPNIDFIAADFLAINPEGDLIAFRKSFHPRWQYFFSNYMYTTTSTLFYRRKVFFNRKFDESYKSIADVIFLYHVMQSGFNGVHIRKYFSVFTFSGKNLSLDPISEIEKRKFNATLPIWYKMLKPIFFIFFFIEKAINNTYQEGGSISYSIFTPENTQQRVTIVCKNPTFRLKFKRSNVLVV